ncbi:MAG: hypothetical protein B7Z23_11320, partial [Pseudomonadales bacterium 32-61-5]
MDVNDRQIAKWMDLTALRAFATGLLVFAMVLCSLPVTHPNHPVADHGHSHAAEAAVSDAHHDALSEAGKGDDNRLVHQHLGMQEHNPAVLHQLMFRPFINVSSQRWGLWVPVRVVLESLLGF